MFSVISVPDDASSLLEPLGTKPKFWFTNPMDSSSWLFKQARPGSGEDWSEKVASELCAIIELPHVQYELASWRNHAGVVCQTFVPDDGTLVLGNELLGKLIGGYNDAGRQYRQRAHTLRVVIAIMCHQSILPPFASDRLHFAEDAMDYFVGYLMLDAWIANQDRHHENWGIVRTPKGQLHLAPTFDHASSLGRNERDATRSALLAGKDMRRSIERYVARAKSAFYQSPSEKKPMSTFDAFREAATARPRAATEWMRRLRAVSMDSVREIVNEIPRERVSKVGIDFAVRMLELNRTTVLAVEDNLR